MMSSCVKKESRGYNSFLHFWIAVSLWKVELVFCSFSCFTICWETLSFVGGGQKVLWKWWELTFWVVWLERSARVFEATLGEEAELLWVGICITSQYMKLLCISVLGGLVWRKKLGQEAVFSAFFWESSFIDKGFFFVSIFHWIVKLQFAE